MERLRSTRLRSIAEFTDKARRITEVGILGAKATNPPHEIDIIFQAAYKTAEHPYKSPQAYPNPTVDLLEADMLHQALSQDEPDFTHLPWQDGRFSKGNHLSFVIAYTDMHRKPIPRVHYVPPLSRQFVDSVMEAADAAQRQLTLAEQFKIGLDLTGGNVLGAAVIAHAGSRSIARDSDTKLDPLFNYSVNEVMHWRDCVSHFEDLSGSYSDPTADTYHFWSTFTPGLLSETNLTSKDKILNPVYKYIYTHMGPAVNLLRYRIAHKTGEVHPEADELGFHIGSMVGAALRGKAA